MSNIAKIALEWWRASGERTKERLLALVDYYAETNGESACVEYHKAQALADIKAWEVNR